MTTRRAKRQNTWDSLPYLRDQYNFLITLDNRGLLVYTPELSQEMDDAIEFFQRRFWRLNYEEEMKSDSLTETVDNLFDIFERIADYNEINLPPTELSMADLKRMRQRVIQNQLASSQIRQTLFFEYPQQLNYDPDRYINR